MFIDEFKNAAYTASLTYRKGQSVNGSVIHTSLYRKYMSVNENFRNAVKMPYFIHLLPYTDRSVRSG